MQINVCEKYPVSYLQRRMKLSVSNECMKMRLFFPRHFLFGYTYFLFLRLPHQIISLHLPVRSVSGGACNVKKCERLQITKSNFCLEKFRSGDSSKSLYFPGVIN